MVKYSIPIEGWGFDSHLFAPNIKIHELSIDGSFFVDKRLVVMTWHKCPYERQPDETKKAFESFIIYRDMGMDRSIRKVAQKLNKSYQLLARWSTQYDWVDRANEYDAEMDRLKLLQEEKERKAMGKRHAKGAMLIQSKAIERLKTIEPEHLEPKDLIKWFVEAVKIERLSRGETTDKAEVAHSGEIKERHEHDITERVERYAEVYAKLARSRRRNGSNDESNNEGDDT